MAVISTVSELLQVFEETLKTSKIKVSEAIASF